MNSKLPKLQIIFNKKSPVQDFIRMTLLKGVTLILSALYQHTPLFPIVLYNGLYWKMTWCSAAESLVETVQDFLCKLGMKPRMCLLDISFFSLNNVIVRLTKIMNNIGKKLKNLISKVIFQHQNLVKSFQKKILWRIFY